LLIPSEPARPGKVTVLGGSGLIGIEVARTFQARGFEVTAVCRSLPTGYRAELAAGVRFLVGDVADPRVIALAVSSAEVVVYAVGDSTPAASIENTWLQTTNLLGPLLLTLDEIKARPGVIFMYLSSGGAVYGNPRVLPVPEETICDPISGYGVLKVTGEKFVGMYAELYGINARILRVSNVYGPLQCTGAGQGVIAAFLHSAASGKAVHLYGDGSVVRDYIAVADVAEAIVRLAEVDPSPRLINVGVGVGHSLLDVIDIAERVTNQRILVEHHEARPFDVRSIVLDVTRLRSTIDWTPATLESGIDHTWTAMERAMLR